MDKIKEMYFKYKEIINYLIVGVLTTIVALVSYYLLTTFMLDPSKAIQLQIANVLSWCIAVLIAYYLNRKYVFESKNDNRIKEFTTFVSGRLLTLFVDMLLMFIFVTLLRINDKIAKLIVQVVITILNYIISKLFVFKKD